MTRLIRQDIFSAKGRYVFFYQGENGIIKKSLLSYMSKQEFVEEDQMLEFKYDTQLLIEGKNLDEDAINDYFTNNFKGDSLLAVGDKELIKIHFHTNEPWKVLEYCSFLGEIYDIVVEDMDRQARGLHG